jgi:hypothetical protein
VPDKSPVVKKAAAKKAAAKKAPVKKVAAKKSPTKKAAGVRKRAGRIERPFPRRPLEEAVRIPLALKEQYGGNPRPPAEVATALGASSTTNTFFYQTAASRDFGFTTGTRDTAMIELDDRGRRYVYAPSGPFPCLSTPDRARTANAVVR